MSTGEFWNVSNPTKPWGLFDVNAQLPIPFDWTEWLADEGATYSSHTITPDPVLQCISSAESDGIILALMKVAAAATPVIGTKYAIKCSIVATVGSLTIKDDRTVYLKLVER